VTGHISIDSSGLENQAPRQVFVCQYRTCHKDGSARILSELQSASPPEYVLLARQAKSGRCFGRATFNCRQANKEYVAPQITRVARFIPDDD
jgi:hypothetical protein